MVAVLSEQEKDTMLLLLEKLNTDWEQKFNTQEGD